MLMPEKVMDDKFMLQYFLYFFCEGDMNLNKYNSTFTTKLMEQYLWMNPSGMRMADSETMMKTGLLIFAESSFLGLSFRIN